MRRIVLVIFALFVAVGLTGPGQAASEPQGYTSVNQVLTAITAGDYIKASNPGINDLFGESVAIHGNTMVIGAWWEDSNGTSQGDNSLDDAGAAYVFVHENGVWRQQAYLKAANPVVDGNFGRTVDISGDTLIISHSGDAVDFPYGGAAFIFVRSGETWTLQATLRASAPAEQHFFSGRVAIDGDTAVVAEPVRKLVTVFVRSGTTWSRQKEILLNNGSISGITSVDISGDTLVASSGNQSGGQAYVYTRTGSDWAYQTTLVTAEPSPPWDNYFGYSTRIDGDTIVAGAQGESKAYVFTRSGTSWTQQAVLIASNYDMNDDFGYAVAIRGDRIVVGAYNEASPATGVNGGQGDDDNFWGAGAAYVFQRTGTSWSQEAYLKASNTTERYYFGWNVAISDKFVAVGSPDEWGASAGVNGNPNDVTLKDAGAVYTFNLPQNEQVSWANAAGGSWELEGNWNPAVIPGATSDVLFNLPDTYDVLVGTRQVGNVDVENGSAGFKNGLLEVTGKLRVSNQAFLTLPEIQVQAAETLVGFLPAADPANPQTAHLNVFNSGTVFTSSLLRVGSAAPAEMFVSNGARAVSTIASIGSGAHGAVVVGGTDALWQMNSLDLGGPQGAALNIEAGGSVKTEGQAVVGGQVTAPQEGALAQVTVSGWDSGGSTSSYWSVDGELVLGKGLAGKILVEDGATLTTYNNLTIGAGADGFLGVEGVHASGEASLLVVSQNLTVGQDGSASTGTLWVTEGARGTVYGNFTAGEHSTGSVLVGGENAAGSLTVSGNCSVGVYGEGKVFIIQGGSLVCDNLFIGDQDSGSGALVIGSGNKPGFLKAGLLSVAPKGEGIINLNAGVITVTDILGVYPSGVINGTGKIVLEGVGMVNDGTINIGDIQIIGPALSEDVLLPNSTLPSQLQPGTLEIVGSLTLSNTSRLVFDLAGKASGEYDRLVLTGTMTLGGQLVLNFSNGYLPANGEILRILQAEGLSGSFNEIIFNGLPEGYTFEINFVEGEVRLVVSAPQAHLYLPIVRR